MKKYAFVTGASGEIGAAIAHCLGEAGYGLFLHYYQHKEEIVELKAILEGCYEIEVHIIQGNFAHTDEVEKMIADIHKPIDTFVHAAGKSLFGLVTDFTAREIQEMIDIHITNMYILSNAFIPAMIQKKCGNIVVISSIWGEIGASCEVLYSMVKGAQNTYVKALAKELAPSGIRVNAVAPGAIDTKMNEIFSKEDKLLLEEEIPLGRLGEAKEVANVVAFLVSEQASYLTGQVVGVNGGWN